MEPSSKIVTPLPAQPGVRRGMAVSVQMVIRLQQVVGNREVQRFLAPKPVMEEPPLPPPPPPTWPQGIRFGIGGAAGALMGGALGAGLQLPIEMAAALAVAGLGIGLLTARLLRGKR